MTGYEKRVTLGLLEKVKERLLPLEDEDLSVAAAVFHLDFAIEELEAIVPEKDGVPA